MLYQSNPLKPEKMEIKLSTQESEKIFFNALCNGLGYLTGYGLELEYSDKQYKTARASLHKAGHPTDVVCYEDVLMQLLRDGGKLTVIDVECEDEYTRTISLADVHARVQTTPIRFLMDMINEEDDAETADVVLQTVFFEDIIFG